MTSFQVSAYPIGEAPTTCALCRFEIKNGQSQSTHETDEKVKHVFHAPCLESWHAADPSCPTCSGKIHLPVTTPPTPNKVTGTYHENRCLEVIFPSGKKISIYPNEKRVIRTTDGIKITFYPNGHQKTVKPSGETTVNSDIDYPWEIAGKNGHARFISFSDLEGRLHVTLPSGKRETFFPDERREIEMPGGEKFYIGSDGSATKTDAKGNRFGWSPHSHHWYIIFS